MIEVFSIPMATSFRGTNLRQGVLIKGEAGWAEWSPFLDYDTAEAAIWLKAALEVANQGFPVPVRTRIEVNVTIPATDPATAHHLASQSGCRTAKVKVGQAGQTLQDDIARVEAVRDGLGPSGKIRVDANGAWSLDQGFKAIKALSRFELEYVEQPCRSVEELAFLRRRVMVPIAADESIRRAEDPYRVKRLQAADIAVLKVQPLGGVQACLRLAEDLAMDVVVSSALETSVGLRAGLALAASLPNLTYACGLNTMALLTSDVVTDPITAADGFIDLPKIQVDLALSSQVCADASAIQTWETRLSQCQSYLKRADDV